LGLEDSLEGRNSGNDFTVNDAIEFIMVQLY